MAKSSEEKDAESRHPATAQDQPRKLDAQLRGSTALPAASMALITDSS